MFVWVLCVSGRACTATVKEESRTATTHRLQVVEGVSEREDEIALVQVDFVVVCRAFVADAVIGINRTALCAAAAAAVVVDVVVVVVLTAANGREYLPR